MPLIFYDASKLRNLDDYVISRPHSECKAKSLGRAGFDVIVGKELIDFHSVSIRSHAHITDSRHEDKTLPSKCLYDAFYQLLATTRQGTLYSTPPNSVFQRRSSRSKETKEEMGRLYKFKRSRSMAALKRYGSLLETFHAGEFRSESICARYYPKTY